MPRKQPASTDVTAAASAHGSQATPDTAADAPATAAEQPITAFKGFDKDFACRGHQFEVGKTYTLTGRIKACEFGFHACENPFDVWSYYGPFESRFAVVKLSGETSRHSGDSKIAAATITIEAELRLPDFIRRAVDWLVEATKTAVGLAAGDKGEDGAQIGSSGYGAQIGSSGYGAQIGSSGNDAQIGSSGYGAQIGSSGYGAQIGSSGNDARIGSSGNDARIGSSGNGARIGSSGNDARIGSSGYDARIGSSGNGARIGSSGYGARIGSSGYGAQIEAGGEGAVIASAGRHARAKGSVGTWLSLAEFDTDGKCVGFATGCIGRDGLPPDTWLVAKGGVLIAERG